MDCPFEGDCDKPCSASYAHRQVYGVCEEDRPGLKCGPILALKLMLRSDEMVIGADLWNKIIAVADGFTVEIEESQEVFEVDVPVPIRQFEDDTESSYALAFQPDILMCMLLGGEVRLAQRFFESFVATSTTEGYALDLYDHELLVEGLTTWEFLKANIPEPTKTLFERRN